VKMNRGIVDFSLFRGIPSRPSLRNSLWALISPIFEMLPQNFGLKKIRIRLPSAFGAKIGNYLVMMPGVKINCPWKLVAGNHAWIGEKAWLQNNAAEITIGNNVCISQGAMLLTGNHDYKLPSFDNTSKPITIEDGAWIGARAIVCPGVTIHSHAVLTVGSVATKDLDAYGIYQGNPAVKVRERRIE
jgi:putative colanic acid biosynthesis acetyltransferase WcaF